MLAMNLEMANTIQQQEIDAVDGQVDGLILMKDML